MFQLSGVHYTFTQRNPKEGLMIRTDVRVEFERQAAPARAAKPIARQENDDVSFCQASGSGFEVYGSLKVHVLI